jgi:transposase
MGRIVECTARGIFKQRTQLINMMRGLLAEFGIDIPQGINRALAKARAIVDGETPDVPPGALRVVERLSQQALDVHAQICEIERDRLAWQRQNDLATRLMTLPGIGLSEQPRWPLRSAIRTSSDREGSSRPGWG